MKEKLETQARVNFPLHSVIDVLFFALLCFFSCYCSIVTIEQFAESNFRRRAKAEKNIGRTVSNGPPGRPRSGLQTSVCFFLSLAKNNLKHPSLIPGTQSPADLLQR